MAESPLDDASERSIAFRRLICRISQQMTRDELKTLVYIRLYSCREAYKECSALEVLSKLESDGMFAPARPEGLADIAKDVRRPDLVHDVRDFMKGKKWHKKVSKLSIKELALARCVSDEEMQLRGTLEVTLTQAALLMLQLDALGVALGKGASQAAVEAVKQAEQTATAIADRLNRTQAAIGAKCTSYEEGEWGMEDYTQMYAIPVQADTQHTGSEGQEEEEEAYEVMKPPLDIRSSHETLLRAEHKPPAAPEYSIPVPKANRQQRASRRWIKQAYSEGDQLLPSPPPDVLSPRASVIKPGLNYHVFPSNSFINIQNHIITVYSTQFCKHTWLQCHRGSQCKPSVRCP